MDRFITDRQIASRFVLSGFTLCGAVFASVKIGGEPGHAVLQAGYLLAALVVTNLAFAWGQRRGFAVRTETGGISGEHLLRNLVMSAVLFAGVVLVFGPLTMIAFQLAR